MMGKILIRLRRVFRVGVEKELILIYVNEVRGIKGIKLN